MVSHEAMIRTEMGGGGGGGTISLNMGPISLGIWGLVGGPISPMIWSHVTREMGPGGGGGISLLHSSELPQVNIVGYG